jgi:hypothetical protein
MCVSCFLIVSLLLAESLSLVTVQLINYNSKGRQETLTPFSPFCTCEGLILLLAFIRALDFTL